MVASWLRWSRCFTEAIPSHVVWERFALSHHFLLTWWQAGRYLSRRNVLRLSNGTPSTGKRPLWHKALPCRYLV